MRPQKYHLHLWHQLLPHQLAEIFFYHHANTEHILTCLLLNTIDLYDSPSIQFFLNRDSHLQDSKPRLPPDLTPARCFPKQMDTPDHFHPSRASILEE